MQKHDPYRLNPCYASEHRTHSAKEDRQIGRKSLSPSVRDNGRLCVKFCSLGDQIGTKNLQFQPSKNTGFFYVILAKLYV